MDNLGFVALTVEDATEFFERCIHKGAITKEERMAVLLELMKEKRVLLAGTLDEKTSETVGKIMSKTKGKAVIGFKKPCPKQP